MALPERRRTSTVTKVAIALDVSMAVTIISLVFWFGKQVEKWDKVAEQQTEQGEAIKQVQTTTAQVSGQVLQMATTSNVAALEARTQVLETKQATTEQLIRDLKADMVERLRRIENKIDQSKER